MLDRKFIRQEADLVRQAIADKRESADLDAFLELDRRHLDLLREVEELQAERNRASESINLMKKGGEDASAVIARTRELSQRTKDLEAQQAELEERLRELQLTIPNIPHPDVPRGGEEDNLFVRDWGVPLAEPGFDLKPHWEVGAELGLMDLERGAKVAGSGFPLLTGDGARFQRSLTSFMLDLHREAGFVELSPPLMVNDASALGTGQLPKSAEQMYRTAIEGLWLIPTAEVPVTNIHQEEILRESELPLRYTAYTPCFRKEAGAHGKDTRGLIRVHQFDKVEMVVVCKPEDSWDQLEKITGFAEAVLQELKIPYRVRSLATGDLSFAAAKCYDIEAYAAGVDKWLEVSSCSKFVDFQARRAGIRFKSDGGGKPQFAHTLNGSGLALPRTVIALMENNQTVKGTIRIPEALRPYMGGLEEIG